MAHPKGVLIERMQKEGKQPTFRTEATGPDHEPTFQAEVIVDGEVLGSGSGGNKKDAEKRAAEQALRHLDRSDSEAGANGAATASGAAEATDTAAAPNVAPPIAAAPFEGPWPVFERVLAASLEIANARIDGRKRGEDAMGEVRDLALTLYKQTLEDLGEIVEVGDEFDD